MSVEINPLDWGWKLSNRSYDPILTDLSAAPNNILRFVRCNCNVTKKSPSTTNVCSCRLSCVSACSNSNGVEWENCDKQEVSSDENSVGSEEETDRNRFNLIFDI